MKNVDYKEMGHTFMTYGALFAFYISFIKYRPLSDLFFIEIIDMVFFHNVIGSIFLIFIVSYMDKHREKYKWSHPYTITKIVALIVATIVFAY